MAKKLRNIDELRKKLKREDDAIKTIKGADPGNFCYPKFGVHGGFIYQNDNDNPRCHCGAVTSREYFA